MHFASIDLENLSVLWPHKGNAHGEIGSEGRGQRKDTIPKVPKSAPVPPVVPVAAARVPCNTAVLVGVPPLPGTVGEMLAVIAKARANLPKAGTE